jgi:hypothetical protein
MSCKKDWSREFLLTNISPKFVLVEYKTHRENVLMDLEKAKLPEAQTHAEQEIIRRKIAEFKKEVYKEANDKVESIFQTFPEMEGTHSAIMQLWSTYHSSCRYGYMVHHTRNLHQVPKLLEYLENSRQSIACKMCCRKLQNHACTRCGHKYCQTCYKCSYSMQPCVCSEETLQAAEVIDILRTTYASILPTKKTYDTYVEFFMRWITHRKELMNNAYARVLKGPPDMANVPKVKTNVQKVTYVRHCPASDCRGFLSTQWKCGICNVRVCSRCHEMKDDKDHVCKQENIESAALLAKEAKPCPSCGAAICKVSGCDQMWCTQCNTAFNWRNNEIVRKGPIHNPHYYDWVRQNGERRNVRDIPCGGLPDFYHLITTFAKIGLNTQNRAELELAHRITGEAVDLRAWYAERRTTNSNTLDIRVKYILKEYTDAHFKKMLQMRAKALEKVDNIDQVLDMFVMAASSIFQRFMDMKGKVDEMLTEFRNLCDYFNDSMQKVSQVYQCKTPYVYTYKKLVRVGSKPPKA